MAEADLSSKTTVTWEPKYSRRKPLAVVNVNKLFLKLVGDKDGGDETVRQLDSSGYLAIPPPNTDGADDVNSQEDSQDASFMAAYGDQTSKDKLKFNHATSLVMVE